MLYEGEALDQGVNTKPVIAVTMATSRQGIGVVNELCKTKKYQIRAITRNPNSLKALKLSTLHNVEVVKGNLLDPRSLNNAFE